MPEEYDYVITKPSLDDVLEHHGVKGMKWGIRKQRPILGLARRRFNTGSGQSSKISKYTKNAKKRKGYSSKDYQKYRKRGMNHNQAIEAAKKDRKKKIAAVAIGAAALTIGVLAARKHNIKLQEAKRLKNQTGDTKALEKQLRERAKKEANAWKDYKFDNADHYAKAKQGAWIQKFTEAENKAKMSGKNHYYKGHNVADIDPKSVKVSGNEVKKYAYRMSQMQKKASETAEARKLKNRVKSSAKRWWNGQ